MTTHEQKMVEWMKHVLLHLRTFALSHPLDEATGKNVDALLALDALSPEGADFLRGDDVQFYGFSSKGIGKDIPVLEMDLTTCRLIGTSAGSVLEMRKQS